MRHGRIGAASPIHAGSGTRVEEVPALGARLDRASRTLNRGRYGGGKINQCRVLRDVIPPTPPGPEGSNGNGLVRAQWVTRYFFAFVFYFFVKSSGRPLVSPRTQAPLGERN